MSHSLHIYIQITCTNFSVTRMSNSLTFWKFIQYHSLSALIFLTHETEFIWDQGEMRIFWEKGLWQVFLQFCKSLLLKESILYFRELQWRELWIRSWRRKRKEWGKSISPKCNRKPPRCDTEPKDFLKCIY